MQLFKVVDTNPNDNTGGGGCLCSETRCADTKGPFVVFYTADMLATPSPHAVLCAGCAVAAAQAVGGEVIAGGEKSTIPATAVPYEPELPAPVTAPDDEDELPDI